MKPVSAIEWSVRIEGRSSSNRKYGVEDGVALMEILESRDPTCYPATSTDGARGAIGATLYVEASSAEEALTLVSSVFSDAAKKALGEDLQVISVEIKTAEEADRELSEPPEYLDLVGIKEVAEILGISRQRASVLSRHAKFPSPIARLAVGPIWLRSSIGHFVEEWERRPGRGLKIKEAEHNPHSERHRDVATPTVWSSLEQAEPLPRTSALTYEASGSWKSVTELRPHRWSDVDDVEADVVHVVSSEDATFKLFKCQAETINTTALALVEHAQKQQEDLNKLYKDWQDTYAHLFEPSLFKYWEDEATSRPILWEWMNVLTQFISAPLSHSRTLLETIEDAQKSLTKNVHECEKEMSSMERSGGPVKRITPSRTWRGDRA